MEHLQAYTFQIVPNGDQQHAMHRIAGSCRYVWSKALTFWIANHEAGEKLINHFTMCKWYASIQTERKVEQPMHPFSSIVGLDAGVTLFVTLSNGTMFEPVSAFRKKAAKLTKYQRGLSRKTKFGNNWKK